MPTLQNVPVSLTADQVLASRGQKKFRPELIRDAEQAIALGQTLWRPVAVYDWYDVHTADGEHVYLSHDSQPSAEAVLHVGPKVELLAGAQRVLVSVGTIGPQLEAQVTRLHANGEALKSFLLDCAGVLALGAVNAALRCLVEETAVQEGWGVSEALSPGSLVGWSLRGQRELCSLLPLETIGVTLNDFYVLEPEKSFSVLIGLGTGYTAAKVGSVCRFCELRRTCWRRREDV